MTRLSNLLALVALLLLTSVGSVGSCALDVQARAASGGAVNEIGGASRNDAPGPWLVTATIEASFVLSIALSEAEGDETPTGEGLPQRGGFWLDGSRGPGRRQLAASPRLALAVGERPAAPRAPPV
jgi:hypothetical protein